ncbi:MAG TPA: hypothetical protein VN903_18700 [Polyangia bacterium]|jgi:hypothetical protein|nr:hypothetical protein [Polyangia bacterium]
MATCNVVSKIRSSLFASAVVMLATAFIPSQAHAQDGAAAMPPPVVAAAPTPAPSSGPRMVGGHVGAAVPVVSFHSVGQTTRTPSDQFTIAVPIGVSVHVAPVWVVDFEVVVASDVKPWGGTTLTIDPGVVYTALPVALGLRAKFDVGSTANFGLIPLIHKGIVDVGEANWFVEAAFPITAARENGYALAAVAHTGFAF